MKEFYDSIKCLCESPQRLQILDALDSTHMNLRELMTKLESPRTTLQRNLSILEQRRWIEDTHSGYTTTTAGSCILEKVVALDKTIETINRIVPFLEAVDEPTTLDISQLKDVRMTVPDSTQPNAPTQRLLNAFDGADRVWGVLPVISQVLVELSHHADEKNSTQYQYIVSRDALDALQNQDTADRVDIYEPPQSIHVNIHIYDKALPYGLFRSEDRLVLVAYNELGRIHALVESDSEEAIGWGKQVYETYKQQSHRSYETDISDLLYKVG